MFIREDWFLYQTETTEAPLKDFFYLSLVRILSIFMRQRARGIVRFESIGVSACFLKGVKTSPSSSPFEKFANPGAGVP
ncbi:MAG: hypothetical protein C4527_09040 [Candidatus Omnitrophota bacterium]|nr:MAG: hypothetical protein C4527_09040 [Candidatus Omnitrophota bacterium]